MYMLHTYIHYSYLLFVTYQKTKKELLGASISQAFCIRTVKLRATSAVFNRGSVSRFEEEAELTEEDEHDYKLPSCVTVKT